MHRAASKMRSRRWWPPAHVPVGRWCFLSAARPTAKCGVVPFRLHYLQNLMATHSDVTHHDDDHDDEDDAAPSIPC